MIETTTPPGTAPTLLWDTGTAYEFFISLHVLHNPDEYGLRASWAAGVRSRIPAPERKFLEEVLPFFFIPFPWIYRLPQPKDAITALWGLRQVPAGKRVSAILCMDECNDECESVFMQIAKRGVWTQEDLEQIESSPMFRNYKEEYKGYKADALGKYLDWWAKAEKFGEMLLSALQAYYQVFFEEEERRVAPVLEAGLVHAQELAQSLDVQELIAELSQGVHLDKVTAQEIILVPAYWITPLIIMGKLDEQRPIFFFGARPATMSAIPGEMVPDGLLRTLKALADPTRLRIIHYISKEELTPSELARRLHLRAPTVTHHLSELRLAGLVNLTMRGQEKLFSARREALPSTFSNLESFLDSTGNRASNALDAAMDSLENKLDHL
jgi:DNA-binding transcriptional ArsR family regulator